MVSGGWLLTSNVVIHSPDNLPSLNLSTSFRNIANYSNNITILSATALRQLYQLISFTQIRFHCYKLSVNRTLNLITIKKEVVDYFTAVTDVRPAACGSFQRGAGDSSLLAGDCSNWGYEEGYWGNNFRKNEWRIHDHSLYVAVKYHWITKNPRFSCDCDYEAVSADDFWKIYVR